MPAETAQLDAIKQRLLAALQPVYLTIIDESAHHIGHEGAKSGGGHYAIEIAAECFAGKSRLASHRMVYQALGDLMSQEIHAAKITIVAAPTDETAYLLENPVRATRLLKAAADVKKGKRIKQKLLDNRP